jgi:hypothetical protein
MATDKQPPTGKIGSGFSLHPTGAPPFNPIWREPSINTPHVINKADAT